MGCASYPLTPDANVNHSAPNSRLAWPVIFASLPVANHGSSIIGHGEPSMQADTRCQLELWREACRHLEMGEFAARVFPLLARHFPLAALLVRQIDPARGWVDTVAAAGSLSLHVTRTEVTTKEAQDLLDWSTARQGLHLRSGQTTLRGLLPEGSSDQWLAGSLDATQGILLLQSNGPSFTAKHLEQLVDLLEPFAVAMDHDRWLREMRTLREAGEADKRALLAKLGRHDISDSIIGAEAGLRDVMQQVERVAGSDVPVLIFGETGAGKEVVARAIHDRSRRVGGPFLRVNCGAIPPELIDSELFGHERGSFTGAVTARAGWFERADGGTLFLDECGELPLAAQVRLLRILQDGIFERVGGERPLRVDVRIVAATHRNLQAMTAAGTFRQDLWYRLAVFPIRLPALRERPEDIPALAAHFALRAATRLGLPTLIPSPEDTSLLVSYAWPGNVRELAAVIERAALLGDGKRLDIATALGSLPLPTAAPPTLLPLPTAAIPTLDVMVTQHIETALARTQGQIEGRAGAAAVLGINPHTLRAKMRKLGIDWKKHRHTVSPCGAFPQTRAS
jgi:hydrogenase-4 transcriptional activator